MHHAVCQTSGDRLCNSVSTTPGGISAACQDAARQRGRRIAQAPVGARGRRRPSPSQAHSCARTGLLPDLSGRWRVARRRIYGDESASRIVCCPDAAAAFRSTLRLIATSGRTRIGMLDLSPSYHCDTVCRHSALAISTATSKSLGSARAVAEGARRENPLFNAL